MSALRGSPTLPKASHRKCLRDLFCYCLEEHLLDATVSCSNPECWKEEELNPHRCGVNVMLGAEIADTTADVINPTQGMYDSIGSMGQTPNCQGSCFGIHKRSMEIMIEVYAVRCDKAMDLLDACICNIESLIAQKQCNMRMIDRLSFTGTQTPEQRSDGRDREIVYTVMRYEAEYTFNPATCTFQVSKCRG